MTFLTQVFFRLVIDLLMSIFDAYDSEFSALSSDISKNISDFRTYSSSNKGAVHRYMTIVMC